jgi:hypothetical protein
MTAAIQASGVKHPTGATQKLTTGSQPTQNVSKKNTQPTIPAIMLISARVFLFSGIDGAPIPELE